MERKFLVLLRRYRLQNEHLYYSICGSLELFVSPSLLRDEALPLGVLWWFETLWLRLLVVITQRILWIVLGTNKSLCACPARPVRAQILAVFRKYYKTARIAPLNIKYFNNRKELRADCVCKEPLIANFVRASFGRKTGFPMGMASP